ncbi:MAG: class I SAM-dependent methyltransferase [Acidobacteria bacterium]|nr:MAG: class I SAM-dependent methyltransferase [Acidobacteriota bacterium]
MGIVWKYGAQAIPRAAGRVDRIERTGNDILVEGWMLLPGVPNGFPLVFVDSVFQGPATEVIREDVARVHPWVADAQKAGFLYRGPIENSVRNEKWASLELIRGDPSRPLAYLNTLIPMTPQSSLPCPPLDLVRQIGSPDAPSYAEQGRKSFSDFDQAIGRNLDGIKINRLLDWGCGCGRISSYFLDIRPDIEITGCDVASNCVEWCKSHLPGGRFFRSGLFPPLDFPDRHFDVVIASSVMTHLTRNSQLDWLREMRRILSPGGLFLASVLGRYSAARECHAPVSIRQRLRAHFSRRKAGLGSTKPGIDDRVQNRSLDGIVPAGYYRNVFQTAEYTREVWSKEMEVLDYIERGLDSYQDLVIVRRPD